MAPEGAGDITGVAVGIGMPLMSTVPGVLVSLGEEKAALKTVTTTINKAFTEMDFMSHRPRSDRAVASDFILRMRGWVMQLRFHISVNGTSTTVTQL